MNQYTDIETERALLATVCAPGNGHHAAQVASNVRAEDFMHPNHQMVFNALLGALKRDLEITPHSLRAELESQGNLGRVGGFSTIVEIMSGDEVEHPDVLVGILKENRARRQTANLAGFIAKASSNPDYRSTLEAVKKACDNILMATSPAGSITAGEIAAQCVMDGIPFSEIGVGDVSARTNIGWIDAEIAIAPTLVTSIGARMGVGKTTMAIQIASHAARMGKRVQFFSLEMGAKDITGKFVSHFADMDAKHLRNNAPSPRVLDYVDVMNNIQIIEGYAGYPWSSIESTVLRNKPDVVVIDYLEYISPIKANDKRADVGWSNLSLAITSLTKRSGIAMVLLVQLHRLEDGQEPNEANVAQTDQVAKDAANLLMLFRKRDGTIWAKVTKARFGERGACRQVGFDGSKNIFREMETSCVFSTEHLPRPTTEPSLY